MGSHEHAQLLLRKASQDEYVLDKLLDDPAAPDEAIGFHAQQAAEKMLKAVLSARGIRFPFTHALGLLIDLLRDNSVGFPEALETIRALSPYAVDLRYGDLTAEPAGPLDRGWAADCVRQTRAWAESMLQAGPGD